MLGAEVILRADYVEGVPTAVASQPASNDVLLIVAGFPNALIGHGVGKSGMKMLVRMFYAGVMGMTMGVAGSAIAFFDAVELPDADRDAPGEEKYPNDDVA